jgi:cyclophilin family peptidyl-prolyl cis-trans isomerase
MAKARIAILMAFLLLAMPSVGAQESGSDWRDNEIDPATWEDGPELEANNSMNDPQPGDPVLVISVSYQPGHFQSVVDGEIHIELFPKWAPLTTANMIMHVESGIYDGIFFHRVIDDFVTQAGDPTCQTIGVYPMTSPECGSGGDGHTLELEHNENLSHVDGAIGMARSQDPDSADTQWYIAETEAHNLDPENRDDEGYATFGIVRMGMSHVRAIALVPTTDDPTGSEPITNPASSAGRPIYEVHISNIDMIGVVASSSESDDDGEGGFGSLIKTVGGGLFSIAMWLWAFALLGGIGWAFRNDGLPFYNKSEIEEVVDALLESDP